MKQGISQLGLFLVCGMVSVNSWAKELNKLVLGSCIKHAEPKPVFKAMSKETPDAVLLMGDNIYADTTNPVILRKTYDILFADEDFKGLKKTAPIYAIWDDHDYGTDDSGAKNPNKEESKNIFLDFFGEGAKDPRRYQPGIYFSKTLGEGKNKVHLIMLDTRFNLKTFSSKNTPPENVREKDGQQILGEEQWSWLEKELKVPSAVKIIVSSVQVFSNSHKWERWSVMPGELKRLQKNLESLKGNDRNVIFLSGDRHFGEIGRYSVGSNFFYEMTSSNLNMKGNTGFPPEENPNVLAKLGGVQYGSVEFQWEDHRVGVKLNLKDVHGATKASETVQFPIN